MVCLSQSYLESITLSLDLQKWKLRLAVFYWKNLLCITRLETLEVETYYRISNARSLLARKIWPW